MNFHRTVQSNWICYMCWIDSCSLYTSISNKQGYRCFKLFSIYCSIIHLLFRQNIAALQKELFYRLARRLSEVELATSNMVITYTSWMILMTLRIMNLRRKIRWSAIILITILHMRKMEVPSLAKGPWAHCLENTKPCRSSMIKIMLIPGWVL